MMHWFMGVIFSAYLLFLHIKIINMQTRIDLHKRMFDDLWREFYRERNRKW